MGPGQGGSQVGMGLGGRKYSGEDIGPGPGRVPGLFHQKRGKNHSYQTVRFSIFIMLEHLFIMYFCIPYMLIVEFHFCVSVS